MPPHEYKWTFKEGDVAVLSICMPGAGFANYFEYSELLLYSDLSLSKEKTICLLFLCLCNPANARRNGPSPLKDKEKPEVNGRVAGTMRRYMPIGNQGHTGVTLHFFVGDNYNPSR